MSEGNYLELLLPLVSLLFILLFVIFVYVYMQKGRRGFFKDKNMKELSRLYLSNKSFISIVKVGEKFYLLGVSENSVNHIDTLENLEEITEINIDEKINNFTFKDILNKEIMLDKINEVKKKIQK